MGRLGICVMSNHVHYLIRPARPADMLRLMHWLNWYSAMLLKELLRRRGHFWERRLSRGERANAASSAGDDPAARCARRG